jgi:hypothetical protein
VSHGLRNEHGCEGGTGETNALHLGGCSDGDCITICLGGALKYVCSRLLIATVYQHG